MRKISVTLIKEKLNQLVIQANTDLREDLLAALKQAVKKEKHQLARRALSAIIENAKIAKKEKLPICQDTGMPVVFVKMGSEVCINGNITAIITEAVAQAYKENFLRASIQTDPLLRKAKPAYAPCIVHTDIVDGENITISLLPKGFGSENKSRVKMLNPTASLKDVEDFVVGSVKEAGASACPPYIIGVGIGGTQDYAGLLAKKALLCPVNKRNKDKTLAGLERSLLKKINALKIGAFGFGGNNTALAVNVQTYPTHIAGLPVAVNISCHALRSAWVTI
ncbi:MAG: fumarate hydratase [Candidatus Omnitrophica bacterium]|nr:fumarate hydratase [Candidatus Omnitrophota bacterium]MBU4478886.1 fumarate hydratase [Candidatus Omnitrophota bacterium]MCG2702960.1 fumarate hydratase [Candidatus Omnitrophota bacterium]